MANGRHSLACRVSETLCLCRVSRPDPTWQDFTGTVSIETAMVRALVYHIIICRH